MIVGYDDVFGYYRPVAQKGIAEQVAHSYLASIHEEPFEKTGRYCADEMPAISLQSRSGVFETGQPTPASRI
jgi:hypothetical protein